MNTENGHSRVVFTFKFPKKIQNPESPESVGLIELTSEEEIEVGRRVTDVMSSELVFELVKRSLYQANGKLIDRAGFGENTIWKTFSAKQRNVVISAYRKIHAPDDEEMRDFLGSMAIEETR